MITASNSTQRNPAKAFQFGEGSVQLLDQTRLPHEIRYIPIETPQQMFDAIRTMVVRGAPAIGVAGAYGVALSAGNHLKAQGSNPIAFVKAILEDADMLATARPTAVNLVWAIERMKGCIERNRIQTPEELVGTLAREARAIYDEDVRMCKDIGRHGATVVPKGARILTHCNAGALATADYGTALGVVRAAFEQDSTIEVFADETRPRLQGARLTSWEMVQEGIPVTLITDNMAAWAMKQGKIDLVVVGADRVAANGDAANKIGTYSVALVAKAHNIPFYVAVPSSTVDFNTPTGEQIPIEERPESEIAEIHGESICPEGVKFYNPAFDVTPAELITGIITEKGIARPPYSESLQQLLSV